MNRIRDLSVDLAGAAKTSLLVFKPHGASGGGGGLPRGGCV